MKIFRNKILMKIIVSICIALTLMNCGLSNRVYADWEGILITPITKLLTTICDGIITLLHRAIQYQDITIVEISGHPDWWNDWGKKAVQIAAIVIVAIVVVASVVYTGGAAAAAGAKVLPAVLKATIAIGTLEVVTLTITGDTIGSLTGKFIAERVGEWFGDTLYMPAFTITPEQIFSNKIWLFDINFFNPMEDREVTIYSDPVVSTTEIYSNKQRYMALADVPKFPDFSGNLDKELELTEDTLKIECIKYVIDKANGNITDKILANNDYNLVIKCDFKQEVYAYGGTDSWTYKFTITNDQGDEITKLEYKREKITSRDGIDISESITQTKTTTSIVEERTIVSTASQLKETISKWYFILRNLALLVLMVVLLYIGIRIVIGSTAGDKAKYKERLMDWLVAVCLIFVMHYIMVFAVELVGRFTELIQTVKSEEGAIIYVPLNKNHINYIQEMADGETTEETGEAYKALTTFGAIVDGPSSTGKELAWTTDIMGKIRIMSQAEKEGTARWVGYALCYMVLVIQTVFFTWTYIKRVLYMAFLTLIAPLVAMTYPIDKINDGKAQAFSAWLKEYIFNLLIQPMHLLLYIVLVTAAYKLAVSNPIYAVVAIGFLMPAEKLVRTFFGFTKARTPGALGGAAGAALAFTGLQSMMKFARGKGDSKNDKKETDNSKIKFTSSRGVNPKETVANGVQGKTSIRKSNAGGAEDTQGTSNTIGQQNSKVDLDKNKGSSKYGGASAGADKAKSIDEEVSSAINTKPQSSNELEKGDNAGAEKKKAGKGKRIFRAVTGAGKKYGRQLSNKMVKRINKARPIRAMARGVTGLAGATALGMAGLALGVASGDPSKAFQYTTAGAAGGYAVGKNIGGKAVDAVSVDTEKLQEEMRMEYLGEDYKDFKFEESVDKMSRDEANINTVRKLTGLSYEDSQEMLGTVGRRCMQSGITNVEDMAAVYKMGQSGYSTDQAIAALKFNKYLPSDLNSMGKEDRDDHINQWAHEYEEAGYENSHDLAVESMRLAETINKIKSDMKKADI